MKRTTFLLLSLVTIAGPSFAATTPDTPVYRLPPIVVIAKRIPKALEPQVQVGLVTPSRKS